MARRAEETFWRIESKKRPRQMEVSSCHLDWRAIQKETERNNSRPLQSSDTERFLHVFVSLSFPLKPSWPGKEKRVVSKKSLVSRDRKAKSQLNSVQALLRFYWPFLCA